MKQQDSFSRQPPSKATTPSGIFGLIEDPGTTNQTDKHAVRVAAGGIVLVRGRGGGDESVGLLRRLVNMEESGWMDDGTGLRGRRFSHMAL